MTTKSRTAESGRKKMQSDLITIFMTGLFGGFGHCIGMCGPIVASYSLGDDRQSRIPHHLLYNLGRVVTYTLLGALVGLSGSFVALTSSIDKLQTAVMALSGLAIVLMGMATAEWLPFWRFMNGCTPVMPAIRKAMALFSGPRSIGTSFPMGLVLGFLPCGLVYTALLFAARTAMEAENHFDGMTEGALMMLLFGLGTTPALILVGRTAGWLGEKARHRFYQLASLIMIATGIRFIIAAFSH